MHLAMVCPHLAYLGLMLEKGGRFAVGIFLDGSVLSRDCPNPLKWLTHSMNIFGRFFVVFTPVPPCHTLHVYDRDICKGNGTQFCAPGMEACSIRTYQFSSYPPSKPR